MNTAILATLLSFTPTDPPLARVEFDHGADSAHVLAYDSDNEIAAEIVFSASREGEQQISAVFPDGVYIFATVRDGRVLTIDSDDPIEAAERLSAVEDLLANTTTKGAGWMVCGFEAVITVGACAAGHIVGCGLGAALTACACVPLLADVGGEECFG